MSRTKRNLSKYFSRYYVDYFEFLNKCQYDKTTNKGFAWMSDGQYKQSDKKIYKKLYHHKRRQRIRVFMIKQNFDIIYNCEKIKEIEFIRRRIKS